MEIDRKEPHFVAALIMAAGCEAVGKLLDAIDGGKRDTHDIFVRELVLPHETLTGAMGRELFKSLRHGIAHSFRPKPILLGDGTLLCVTVNWGTTPPHLGPRRHPPGIWVNLPTMKADFEAMLNKYRRHFQETSKSGREPSEDWKRESLEKASKETDRTWHAFLGGSVARRGDGMLFRLERQTLARQLEREGGPIMFRWFKFAKVKPHPGEEASRG
jgi:hypothetical protein